MNKILVMEKSLDDAIAVSFNAIEKNDFSKVIRLLEYVKKYKKNYDEVTINYALLISYMNTHNSKEAIKIIAELDQMEIQNPQIAEVLNNIKKDLKVHVTNKAELSYEQIIKQLKITEKMQLLTNLYNEYGENSIWSSLINPEEIGNLRYLYQNYQEKITKWYTLIVDFSEFTDEVKPIDLFQLLKEIEADAFFWFNFPIQDLAIILNNQALPTYVKNFVLACLAYYTNKKIIANIKIQIPELGGEITTYDLPIFTKQINEIAEQVSKVYDLDTENNEETIQTMIKSVIDVIVITNYPNDVLKEQVRISAIVAYIVNDIFMGREYDVLVNQKFGYEFKQLKSDIKNYEKIITFLIT